MNYVVIDTSNIVLWVSVCVRNMNVKDFAFLKLYEKLINYKSKFYV